MKKSFYILLLVVLPHLCQAQVSFTQQTTPVSSDLLGICFANKDTGYACGSAGVILKTTNGGTNWTQLSSGTTKELWDIKTVPGSNGQKLMAVGVDNTVLKSTNGGTSWTPQSIPFMAGSFVFGIHCLDDQNYFACGGDFATTSGAVLKTTNGGNTWTSVPVSTSFFLDKIFMLNATTGYLAGTNTTATNGSIHRTTNGNTWTLTKASASVITNIWATATNNIVAAGLGGQIWRSTDNGANWTSVSSNTTDLYGICFANGKTGFACGGDVSSSVILTTADSGKTWTQVSFSSNTALKAVSIAGNRVFMAGDGGKIIRADLPATNMSPIAGRQHFMLYPNPASGIVKVLSTAPATLRLTTEDGKLVLKTAFNAKEIDISSVADGIYILTLYDSNGNAFASERIVKVRR